MLIVALFVALNATACKNRSRLAKDEAGIELANSKKQDERSTRDAPSTPMPALQATPAAVQPVEVAPAQTLGKSAPVSPITQAAVAAGVLSCASRINQVSTFLTGNSQSGAVLFTPPAQPDQRLFSSSLEISGPGEPLVYASSSFAPNQVNGCGALYETVTYWPGNCQDVGARIYGGLKSLGMLGQQTIALDAGPAARIFLMPAGNGCISIKKEVLLQ